MSAEINAGSIRNDLIKLNNLWMPIESRKRLPGDIQQLRSGDFLVSLSMIKLESGA